MLNLERATKDRILSLEYFHKAFESLMGNNEYKWSVDTFIEYAKDLMGKSEKEGTRIQYEVNIRCYCQALITSKKISFSDDERSILINFMNSLKEFRDNDNYCFSLWMFNEHIPHLQEDLVSLKGKANLNFLEVGCAEGEGTVWYLNNILTHPTSKITCVDVFSDEQNGDLLGNYTKFSNYEEVFDYNINNTSAANKVTKKKGFSSEMLPFLKPDSFDFISIDAGHTNELVFQDAAMCWRLLKVGGIMVFDDYELYDENDGYLVRTAVDSFLECFKDYLIVLSVGYQVTIQRTKCLKRKEIIYKEKPEFLDDGRIILKTPWIPVFFDASNETSFIIRREFYPDHMNGLGIQIKHEDNKKLDGLITIGRKTYELNDWYYQIEIPDVDKQIDFQFKIKTNGIRKYKVVWWEE